MGAVSRGSLLGGMAGSYPLPCLRCGGRPASIAPTALSGADAHGRQSRVWRSSTRWGLLLDKRGIQADLLFGLHRCRFQQPQTPWDVAVLLSLARLVAHTLDQET